jgi:nitroimidazol reductase NimA-like FMN-containing flavoprotein (pyridoxamine 5'-phosphate oxidase superfamily)
VFGVKSMNELHATNIREESFPQTERTTLHRIPKRASYDKKVVYDILDEAFICHIGFIAHGKPCVIPTAYGRIEDSLYIHGAPASRMLRSLEHGVNLCATVTLIDGVVLARSAFHHSMNYRSVMIFGKAVAATDDHEKEQALYAFSEHIIRGRWNEVRPPNEKELAGTLVLKLPLQEVSAKVRTGPPVDDQEDLAIPVWAGVVPLSLVAGAPVADAHLLPAIEPPHYATNYRRLD